MQENWFAVFKFRVTVRTHLIRYDCFYHICGTADLLATKFNWMVQHHCVCVCLSVTFMWCVCVVCVCGVCVWCVCVCVCAHVCREGVLVLVSMYSAVSLTLVRE